MVVRVALAAMVLAACGFDADYAGTTYQCREECPSGQTCVDDECRPVGGVIDGAPGGADAAIDAAPLTGYAAEVVADGPLLYLRLDETEGLAAKDSSGSDRHGEYTGGVTHDPDGAFAGSNGCVRVDGVTGRVVVQDDEALRLNGDWSIELWVKLDEVVNDFPGVIAKGGASAETGGYIIYYTEARVLTLKRGGNDGNGVVNEPITTAGFRHYVLTYDGGTGELIWYVDGGENAVRTEVWGPNESTSPLSIGRGDHFGAQWLDEVAIYDRVLSQDRVEAHYDAALAP